MDPGNINDVPCRLRRGDILRDSVQHIVLNSCQENIQCQQTVCTNATPNLYGIKRLIDPCGC